MIFIYTEQDAHLFFPVQYWVTLWIYGLNYLYSIINPCTTLDIYMKLWPIKWALMYLVVVWIGRNIFVWVSHNIFGNVFGLIMK